MGGEKTGGKPKAKKKNWGNSKKTGTKELVSTTTKQKKEKVNGGK